MVRVGVIDSGGPADDPPGERAMARAFLADGAVHPAEPDRLGHGTAVAAIIRRAAPGAAILHAQVFGDRPLTSALRVAAALRWFAAMAPDQRPEVICLSLGLAADRAPLERACAALTDAGAVLVAAHPARGPACYPAAYPGVIAATGDARCGWDTSRNWGRRFSAHGAIRPNTAPPAWAAPALAPRASPAILPRSRRPGNA